MKSALGRPDGKLVRRLTRPALYARNSKTGSSSGGFGGIRMSREDSVFDVEGALSEAVKGGGGGGLPGRRPTAYGGGKLNVAFSDDVTDIRDGSVSSLG